MNKLKICIVGYGFVGKAIDNGFDESLTSKLLIDPKLKTSLDDLVDFKPDLIFISVPTPMSDDGDQDITTLNEIIDNILKMNIDSIIAIKSTVLPNNIRNISSKSKNIIYNPEFLTEKNANNDFINSQLIIFGGDLLISKKLAEIYSKYSKCKNKQYKFLDALSASFVKYSINTFLATKVIFFNEMHSLVSKHSQLKDNWNNIISTISADPRIGETHMNVPGHDGRYGFGGACLPKDSMALLKYAYKFQEDLSVIKQVVKKNNMLRRSYETLSERELEQNISYDDKI